MSDAIENEEKPKKRTPKKTAEILTRGKRILELRRDGYSLREISSQLKKEAAESSRSTRGFSHEQVRKDFQEIVRFELDQQQDTLDEIRMLAAERLESVMKNYMPYVELKVGPDTSDNEVRMKLKAGDTVLKAMREHNELYGIKTPQKLELTGKDGKDLIPQQFIVEIVTNDSNGSTTDADKDQ